MASRQELHQKLALSFDSTKSRRNQFRIQVQNPKFQIPNCLTLAGFGFLLGAISGTLV